MYCGRYQCKNSLHSVGVRARLAIPRFRPVPVAFAVVTQVDEVQKVDHQPFLGNCWATMSAASAANCDAVLAVLESVDAESSALFVKSIVEAPHVTWSYAFLPGAASTVGCEDAAAVTAGDINSLACLLDAIAVSDQPRMRCVPLLAAAGWTFDRMASLPLVNILLVLVLAPSLCCRSQRQIDEAAADSCTQQMQAAGGLSRAPMAIASELERLRPKFLPRWVTQKLIVPAGESRGEALTTDGNGEFMDPPCDDGWPRPLTERPSDSGASLLPEFRAASQDQPGNATAAPAAAQPQSEHQQPVEISGTGRLQPHVYQSSFSSASLAHYVTLVDGMPARGYTPLGFERVAVGGTFDRLHAGHELLLAATALVAKRSVFVGVTADALLANKSHRDLLQPYETRVREAVSYMQAVRPGLQVEAGPLSDPKVPTLAELDPDMEALVVSVETLPGAAAINAGRRARGFRPLTVITVPVIGLCGSLETGKTSSFSNKLSSSRLRALEAAAASTKPVDPIQTPSS
ncbi:hypothetical protein Vretimale_18970 [Volvox reticuliferus]|uniref:Cytidyltransferase-like domain-containing protein n=1 Tax=Volvox reticuliferus TaxID=1737510 RepID=A0A8J4GY34_9CHLO|nr:hypothetical protein Vretifemale_20072 [Volvox reticuliferus]GIM16344.1 hypothetical protein Vretimale_18970 [Volvox reticuliferus]